MRKKRTLIRILSVLLMSAMLLPLMTVVNVVSAEEVLLYGEDFSKFSKYQSGQLLTRADGFAKNTPSTTHVKKKNQQCSVGIDFASGAENPDELVWYLPNSSYAIVDEKTEGALCTDRASYGLISGSDPNLNVGLVMPNPEISYVNHKTVIIEMRYYFEEGANGSIYAQIQTYYTNGTKKNFLPLFNIDPETAVLNTQGGSSGVRLEYGKWNVISMVIDLEGGVADYYLNYALYSTGGSLGATNIVIPTGTLIAAKIHRTTNVSHKASEELAGSFYVDDVRIYTPGKDTVVTVSEKNEAGDPHLETTLWKNDKVLATYGDASKYLCTNGVRVTSEYFRLDPNRYRGKLSSLGASLRTDEHGGIRFCTSVEKTLIDGILSDVEAGILSDVSFGTLIAPLRYVEEAGAFTFDALGALNYRVSYLDVPSEGYGKWYFSDDVEEKAGAYTFAGSITSIDPSHADDDFVGRGYLRVTHPSGVTAYIYADWNGESASLAALAGEKLASGEELIEETLSFLESAILTPVADCGGEVKEIYFLQNRLFFRIDNDIYAALTYTGRGGWRLKAQAEHYIGFTAQGAAQALAYYMEEEPDETVLPIRYEICDEVLTVTCEDGSRVEISLAENFVMRVYAASGREVSCILDVGLAGEDMLLMRGRLDATEAVFGGGEKFDSVNRRGMLTRLYSTDGWNKSEASYMTIPLFFTSRGGGFFFNRYEDMLADFGYAIPNEWSLTIKNDAMDCYLYATEEGKEVISNYARMTGTTNVPEEWAQGVMICRYSSDLTRFETDTQATNKDGAPSGRSVKTMVTSLIEAGMKPSAMVMEAWNYGSVSYETEAGIAAREELQKTIDWLDELGIRTMLYMRVGSSVNASMKGYKDEYFVSATLLRDGVISKTRRIPDVTNGGVSGNPDTSSTSSGHIYLDVTNPEAVEWYCDVFWGQLVDMGIDGVKIDFCETMPDEGYVYGDDSGNVTVERYDWYDRSKMAVGGEHHAYPVYFISTFYKKMNERKLANGETDGFYVLSRGGGVGSQRNSFLWAGDQARAFVKLDDQLMAVVTSGLSGVPNMTYDMAGYRYNGGGVAYTDPNSWIYESEMFARAIEFTAFMVNIQTHGTVRNVYELSDGTQEIYRIYTKLHSELSDYITRYMTVASETGIPAVRHPVLEYQSDVNVYSINDQFLLGEGLMIAPILAQNTFERTVYLPEGSWTNLLTGEIMEGGKAYTVSANIGQVPVFLNNDSADAEELREIFNGETWQKVANWNAPLDSTAEQQ